jgi:hypothetical protein
VRYFGIEAHSTGPGCITAAIGAAIALGAVLLRNTLKVSGTFNTFLICAAIRVTLGSVIFLIIGRAADRQRLVQKETKAAYGARTYR